MTTMRLSLGERTRRSLQPGPALVTVLLATFMVMAVMHNIVAAKWSPGLEAMRFAALGGAAFGAVMATWQRIAGWLVHLVMLLLGFGWSLLLMRPLFDARLDSAGDRLTELLIRTIIWIRAIKSNSSTEDYLLFILLASLAAWFFAFLTMWLIFRANWAWGALLLNGVAIMVNLTFALPKPRTSFWLFLVFGLLLIVFENYRGRQQGWHDAALEQEDLLSWHFLWSGVVVCTLLVIGTSILPSSITNQKLTLLVDRITSPFAGIKTPFGRSPAPAATAPQQATFTRSGVPLGGARTATNRVVMEVKAPRPEYWRANALDFYNGTGWENTTGAVARGDLNASSENAALSSIAPGLRLIQVDTAQRVPMTQTFTLLQDRGDQQLPAATTPLTWSMAVLVQHTFLPSPTDDDLIPNYTDSSIYFAQSPVKSGLQYTVVSLVSEADKQSLRGSSTDYPAWITRYLQLPEDQPMRNIAGLARQIVAEQGARNPYDQAVAIESYLRTFPYDDQIQAAPQGVDPINYFLFEIKRGYCDYFASAMVLMLRSQGIPARWVQGYATGEFSAERNAYVVRDTVAHSWPEVYFTGYGWQRFEPTPSGYVTIPTRAERPPVLSNENDPNDIGPNQGRVNQPPALDFDRLEELKSELADQTRNKPVPTPAALPPLQTAPVSEGSRIFRGLAWLMFGAGLMAVALWWIRRRETRGLRPAAAFYAGIGQLARWAGIEQYPAHTPEEYARHLSEVLPNHRQAIERVAEAYTEERYRRHVRLDYRSLREDAQAISRPLAWRATKRLSLLLRERLLAQRKRSRRR